VLVYFAVDTKVVDLVGRLLFFWGCHQLGNLGCAKHHPQKRHIPRQAGLWYYIQQLFAWANLPWFCVMDSLNKKNCLL
jgi:hypothetical protein